MPNETSLPKDAIAKVQEEAKAVIMQDLLPAYKKIQDFIRDEYMPATRQQIGLLSATEGLDFYEKTLKAQISVDCKLIA